MTIQEAIDQIDDLKPNTYSATSKLRWLNQLDGMIYRGLVLTHEGSEGIEEPKYTVDEAGTTQLIAQEPHDQMYVHWLESRIDYYNSEIQKYNNSNAVFQTDYQEYALWYNRNHMPLGTGYLYF